jgi:2-furoyl-CoA dehydrogenase large subunit
LHSDPGLIQAQPQTQPVGHIGQPMQRLEDEALLRGRGRYADDLGVSAGTLHAAVLRSPHAHAELLAVDASAALALPGVRAVLTGAGRATLEPALRGRREGSP